MEVVAGVASIIAIVQISQALVVGAAKIHKAIRDAKLESPRFARFKKRLEQLATLAKDVEKRQTQEHD